MKFLVFFLLLIIGLFCRNSIVAYMLHGPEQIVKGYSLSKRKIIKDIVATVVLLTIIGIRMWDSTYSPEAKYYNQIIENSEKQLKESNATPIMLYDTVKNAPSYKKENVAKVLLLEADMLVVADKLGAMKEGIESKLSFQELPDNIQNKDIEEMHNNIVDRINYISQVYTMYSEDVSKEEIKEELAKIKKPNELEQKSLENGIKYKVKECIMFLLEIVELICAAYLDILIIETIIYLIAKYKTKSLT